VVVDTAAGTVAGMAVGIVAGKEEHQGCVRCLRIGRKTGVAQSERTEASAFGIGQARTCRFDEDPQGRVIRCMFVGNHSWETERGMCPGE
jgi:ribosomal protein L37E